jgi:hypothetical protein
MTRPGRVRVSASFSPDGVIDDVFGRDGGC